MYAHILVPVDGSEASTAGLREAGFMLTDLEEPVAPAAHLKGQSRFVKLCAEVPPFLLLRAEKRR